jgi:hypothetical protein
MANKAKLEKQGMNIDEWVSGVKYKKLPEHKTAGALDYALPAAGALGGAYLGKLFRDKSDPEDDSWTKPLIGGALGLGAGLLGNAAVGGMVRDSREAEAAKVNQAVEQHAKNLGLRPNPYKGTKERPVGGYHASGRYVDPSTVAQSLIDPRNTDWGLHPDEKGMYTLSPGMKVRPETSEQARRLGMPDVADRLTIAERILAKRPPSVD